MSKYSPCKINIQLFVFFLISNFGFFSNSARSTEDRNIKKIAHAATVNQKKFLNDPMSEVIIKEIQRQIGACYKIPVRIKGGIVSPVIQVRMNRDGTLGDNPKIKRLGTMPIDQFFADKAIRAILFCTPLKIPSEFQPYYNDWKVIIMDFQVQ